MAAFSSLRELSIGKHEGGDGDQLTLGLCRRCIAQRQCDAQEGRYKAIHAYLHSHTLQRTDEPHSIRLEHGFAT